MLLAPEYPQNLDAIEAAVRDQLGLHSLTPEAANVLQRVLLVLEELREWRLQAVEAQRLISQLRATLLPPLPPEQGQ